MMNMNNDFAAKLIANVTDKVNGHLIYTQVGRLRAFFDRSLWSWFNLGIYFIIGCLVIFLSYCTIVTSDLVTRLLLTSLIALIVAAVIIGVMTYEMHIPLNKILGTIIDERYTNNLLSGVYFGTQIVRWVVSLYFYHETPDQKQSQSTIVIKYSLVIFVLILIACLSVVL